MSHLQGNLLKMKSEYRFEVNYHLPLGNELIYLNTLLGHDISIKYKNQINCIHCGRKTRTSFHQGYCYPCFQNLPQTDQCILKPELCEAHNGISRDMEWSEKNCLQDHFVYLALTSVVKVGVTRHSQVPTRWIDQGAWKVIKLAKTPNRHLAGLIEVNVKKVITDKTNWRHMLSNKLAVDVDLSEEKERIKDSVPDDLKKYIYDDNEITEIQYPVIQYPAKVKSINFDKVPEINGKLTGIKGQYLMFDSHYVINIRKHSGYLVEIDY